MLAAISLLALAASKSMILQQHMAANFSDGQQARQAAAIGIQQGEALLFSIGHDARFPACHQDCFASPLDKIIRQTSELPLSPEFENASWWQSQAFEAGADPVNGPGRGEAWSYGPKPPRFLIEELYFDDLASASSFADAPVLGGIGYYRVLARGTGRGPAAVTVDEAIIARPWLSAATPDSGTPDEKDSCSAFGSWYDCGLMAWRQRR
jgi:Tfp pilus assembly protein PilX